MTSGDLLPYDPNYAFQERTRVVRENVEFEFIFNTHGDEEDALRSASYIQPDSVVFLEGSRLEQTDEPIEGLSLGDLIAYLSALRLKEGKDSPEYTAVKDAAIQRFDALLGSEEREEDPWGLAIRKALIEKDCVILGADFDSSAADYSDGFITLLKDGRDAIGSTVLGFQDDMGAGKALRRSARSYSRYIALQHTREAACTVGVGSTMINLFENFALAETDMRRTEQGNVQAYAVWGTAHSHSLTEAFTDKGFQVAQNIVDPDTDVRFIPTNSEIVGGRAREVVLADVLYDAIGLTGFSAAGKPFLELVDELSRRPQEGFVPIYIRAFQLHRVLSKLDKQDRAMAADENRDDINVEYRSVAHNLRNLLSDLGLAADTYVRNPFPTTDNA